MEKRSKTKSKSPRRTVKSDHTESEISPYEWDFRRVRDEELLTVVLYEYTRSCPRVRATIEEWHAQRVNYRTLLQLDCPRETRPLLITLARTKEATNAHAVEIAFDPDTTTIDADARSLFLIHLWFAGPKDEVSFLGQSVATTFGNLDHPWEQLRAVHGDEYLKARLFTPSSREGIMGHLGPPHTWEHLIKEQPGMLAELLLIDWSLPIKQLVGSFRRWVQGIHPGTPAENRRPRGRKPQWEYLRWLAAYRFHQSGYNYERAQVLIRSHIGTNNLNNPHEVLPNYSGEAAWGKAVARATSELAGDFTRSIKDSFPLVVCE